MSRESQKNIDKIQEKYVFVDKLEEKYEKVKQVLCYYLYKPLRGWMCIIPKGR